MQQNINNRLCLKDKSEEKLFGMPGEYDYSKFAGLEDFELDYELMDKFLPIAKKLDLSQESVEMLLEIALEMSKKQKARYEKDEETRQAEQAAKYNKLFEEDCELPSQNSLQINEYLSVANGAYSEFCSEGLKELFKKTGLIYHPELVKMFHKIGELAQEDNLSYNGRPQTQKLTPAEILYGTN